MLSHKKINKEGIKSVCEPIDIMGFLPEKHDFSRETRILGTSNLYEFLERFYQTHELKFN